ncbi:rhodanese-like domain-containing protein [Sessilibacter sp. MAH2]
MTMLQRASKLIAGMFMLVTATFATANESAAEIPDNAIWLDVRSLEEYKSGHVDGALNIPHTKIEEQILGIVPDKDTPVYLYCRSGHRSNIALNKMKELGYTNLQNVGGLNDAREFLKESEKE